MSFLHRTFVLLPAGGVLLCAWPSLFAATGEPDPATRAPDPATDPATVSWTDFDQDGRVDALVVGAGRVAIHRDGGDGALADVSLNLGIAELASIASGRWIDFDADGWVDLALVDREGRPSLWKNEEGLRFVDATRASGLDPEPVVRLEWVDANDDGRVDLVAVGRSSVRLWTNRAEGGFTPVEVAAAPELATNGPTIVGWDVAAEATELSGGGSSNAARRSASASQSLAATPGTRVVAGTSPPNVSAASAPPKSVWPTCVNTIADQAGGACIEASRDPVLGALYPQSISLNVDATGKVGVGRTGPLAQLHAQTTGATALRADSDLRAAFLSTTNPSVPTLEVRSAGYSGFFEGRLDVGYRGGSPIMVNRPRAAIDVDTTNAGRLSLLNDQAIETVRISAQPASAGAELSLFAGTNGSETVELTSEAVPGRGPTLRLRHPDATETVYLTSDFSSAGGAALYLYGGNGQGGVSLRGNELAGTGGIVQLHKPDGTATITLDADYGGSGRVRTEVLEITGGADLAESFDTGTDECPPGSVVVIDPQRPGELALATEPYDRRVAGIVSGAGGIRPGLEMGQEGVASGSTPVALTGRVWVRATAENGSITPGDLLTSGATPGHAMRATDRERAFGSVLGKAMTALEGESGLVLVLVSLQ